MRYQNLKAIEKYALFLLTFVPRAHDAAALFSLMSAKAKGGSVRAVERMLAELARQNHVREIDSRRNIYALAHRFDRATIADMVRDADQGNWWPTVSALKKAEYASSYGWGMSHDSELEYAMAKVLRDFTAGPGARRNDPALDEIMKKEGNAVSVYRGTAYAAASILLDDPDFDAPGWTVRGLETMPYWLNIAFSGDRPVKHAMEILERRLEQNEIFSEHLARVYGSMAFWRDEPERVKYPALDGFGNTISGIRAALAGDFELADGCFRRDISAADDRNAVSDYDNLPDRFMRALVCIAAHPDKLQKTRPMQLFKGQLWRTDNWYMTLKAESHYRQSVENLSQAYHVCWPEIVDGKGKVIKSLMKQDIKSGIDALLAAFDYRHLAGPRAALSEKVSLLVQAASNSAQNGYKVLADTVVSLVNGGFATTEWQPLLDDLAKTRIHPIPTTEPPPDWRSLLAVLDKALPKKIESADRKNHGRRLFWYISLKPDDDFGNYRVDNFAAAIRPAGGSDDGEDDTLKDIFDFNIQKYSDIASERDRLLAASLKAGDGDYEDTAGDVLEILCGMDNLIRCDDFDLYGYRRQPKKRTQYPLRIEKGDCRLETTSVEDGGLALQLPSWLHDLRKDHCLHRHEDDRFEFVGISRNQRKLIDALANYGARGRIVIPGAAMPSAEKIFNRLAAVMPLAEKSGGEAGDLRRVAAAADVRLRLAFADDTLSVHAVVQPLADNPHMVFDPGVGIAEKLVVGAASSYVLVRDLAAEAAAFAAITALLAPQQEWFDGRASWTIDNLVSALEALAALKAANPPVTLEWLDEKRLSVTRAPKSGVKLSSSRTAEDWFRVDGEFRLDDGRVLGVMELLTAMAERTGDYVRLSDGDYVALTKKMVKQLEAMRAAGRRKGDGLEIVKAALPMLDNVFGEGEDSLELPDAMAVTAEEIRAAFTKRPSPPATLKAELRPYQQDGYKWLSQLAACGFGACLADDMGLGKTVQVIALLLERAAAGASLVIAPSSVCGNWRNELRRFAPTLRPVLVHETPEILAPSAARPVGTVVIASYGYLLFHAEEFAAIEWNGLVLDEAQAIKNDASKRAKLVKRLKSRFRIAATGTPVENRLGELWSLFDFLNPGLLGPAASFMERLTEDGKATAELKRLVKPLILRRIKGDVLEDLPEKTEVTIPIELGNAERTAYEACRRRALSALEEQGGEVGRMTILAELTRLRRFCCHPSLVLGTGEVPSAKLEALTGILDDLKAAGHRALVFSQFTDYLAIVRRRIESRGWTHLYLDGSTPTAERGRLVDSFQSGEGDFFVISLKAGGTGLNLTAADYVILLDPWWNPAVENQAADRAHRIGQRNPVTVYRLIASNTVEERVIELHREKKEIAEDVLDGTGSASLTPAQLLRLFT